MLLAAVSTIYFLVALSEQWRVLPNKLLTTEAWPWIAVATLVYSACAVNSALAWQHLLRATGEKAAFRQVLRIWLLAQIAKYIPGNVGQYLSRIGLAHAAGYRTPRVITTVAIETAAVLTAAGLLAGLVLTTAGPEILAESFYSPPGWVFALAGVGVGGITLMGLRVSLGFISRHWSQCAFGATVQLPGIGIFVLCCCLYSGSFLLMGLTLELLAHNLFDTGGSEILLLTGIYAVAWVLGFVMPGAPGGLGVREVVLLAALDPLYGSATAVGLAVALRLVTTLGDGVSFLAGFAIRPGPSEVQDANAY